MSREARRVADKWAAADAGEHYATHRFRSQRAAQRDTRLVGAILRDLGVRGRVLDVPCGTGRLRETLARCDRQVVGVDVSRAMLEQARATPDARVALADVRHLPFAARRFDVVVCCRLLHHLREQDELGRAVAELVRVSNRLVIASFWDSAAWPTWRAGLGLARTRGRHATSRASIASAFADAGARVTGYRGVLRFVSQQTFVIAERP